MLVCLYILDSCSIYRLFVVQSIFALLFYVYVLKKITLIRRLEQMTTKTKNLRHFVQRYK